MTKEEIRKEAEERVNICTPYHTGSFIQGYIAGAEPRENKIADIKANCDLAIEGRDIKIKELERENAELKAFRQDCVKLTEDNVVMARQRAEIARQLTKAKEIIKDLLRLPYANDWEVYGDVTSYLDKAEQFLKEIEK